MCVCVCAYMFVFVCVTLEAWTTEPKSSNIYRYICSNIQQYIVWVKIIYFLCQKSLGY